MKVGIIGAMEQEVTILKEAITNCKTVNKAGCTFFSGQINDVEVVVLQSGIGKVAAAVGTTILLDEYQPDVVINTGSGTCTVGANSNTTVGALTVAAGASGHFRIRRTATNTFTVYRCA